MSGRNRFTAATAIGVFLIGWVAPAAAYRPFDGTDAAVADLGEVEIELHPEVTETLRIVVAAK